MDKIVPFTRFIKEDAVHDRIFKVLGKDKAPEFISNLTGIVNSNTRLSQCYAESIMSAALESIKYNVPLGMGMVSLAPYGKKVQVQVQKRGYAQFMIRTDKVKHFNYGDVREGELVGYDRLRGVHEFRWITNEIEREKKKVTHYFAYVELFSGYFATECWDVDRIEEHGRTYSTSYQYWLKNKDSKRLSVTNYPWADPRQRPNMMGKTVFLRLVREKAPLSTLFQDCRNISELDQSVFDKRGHKSFSDNPLGDQVIEADIIEAEDNFKAKKTETKKQSAKNAHSSADEPVSADNAPTGSSSGDAENDLTPEEVAQAEKEDSELADASQEDTQEGEVDWEADPGK